MIPAGIASVICIVFIIWYCSWVKSKVTERSLILQGKLSVLLSVHSVKQLLLALLEFLTFVMPR
jgi:hypothetical protein